MQEQWNDGIIIGFCSKEQSERILRSTLRPTMLIRFSDMVIGYLKISCKLPDHRVVHYETEAEKMPIGTSIADAIRSNPTFAYIQYIYPNRVNRTKHILGQAKVGLGVGLDLQTDHQACRRLFISLNAQHRDSAIRRVRDLRTGLQQVNSSVKHSPRSLFSDDWSEPGYVGSNNGINNAGVPTLDSIKPIDPQLCTGGFSSTIKCGYYGGCPPGLVCDYKTNLCCPMLMSINEPKHHHAPSRRNYHHHPTRFHQFSSYNNYMPNNNNYYQRMQMMQRYPNYMTDDMSQQMRSRRPMGAYPCSNCDDRQQYYPMNSMSSLNSVNNNMVCPDGTQAAGGCVNGQCGFGFMCNQGLCCTNSSQTPRCLDGSQAIGACIGGKCGEGYTCTTGNICCPSTLSMCPVGTSAIGPCVNGVCPVGYACINNQCCGPPSAANSTNLLTTCSQVDSNGPCLSDNTCPDPGFNCDITNQWCCPNIAGDPVGPCIRGEGGTRLCPDGWLFVFMLMNVCLGYACSGPDGGQCYRLETGTCAPQDQFGPCNPTEPKCPSGG
ncbi:SH2 domain and EF-hand domain pair-containing protein [Aphelenchoides besseyi]|nr:SH2 domain and EF-hand domain pair-containing protein [Aphelenchoides besseyi]